MGSVTSSQATASQIREFWSAPMSAPVECHVILAASSIFENSLAMKLTTGGTAGKAQPYVAGTANATLLGCSRNDQIAPPATDLVYPDDTPAIFLRGIRAFNAKLGDEPTDAQLNVSGGVAFADSNGNVQKTLTSNYATGTLRAITGGRYWVELP